MKKVCVTFKNQEEVNEFFEFTGYKHNIPEGCKFPFGKHKAFDIFGQEFGPTKMYLGLHTSYDVVDFITYKMFFFSDKNINEFIEFKPKVI